MSECQAYTGCELLAERLAQKLAASVPGRVGPWLGQSRQGTSDATPQCLHDSKHPLPLPALPCHCLTRDRTCAGTMRWHSTAMRTSSKLMPTLRQERKARSLYLLAHTDCGGGEGGAGRGSGEGEGEGEGGREAQAN